MTRFRKPNGNYEVGYGKPPQGSRFRPGQSGNPRGRPKKIRITTIEEALGAELSEIVTVTINGKSQKMTRAQLLAKQHVTGKGDDRAMALVSRVAPKKTEPSEMSELSGAAERLAQRLRLIIKRREEREPLLERLKGGEGKDRGNSG